jgi:PadR family transcriptional regulator PadR
MANGSLKTNVDLLIMGVLRHGHAHGYAIIGALRDRSEGEFELAEGTIYPALHRLERAGLIDSSIEVVQGRRRRTYALTPRGRKEFNVQRREWQGFVAGMQAVLG